MSIYESRLWISDLDETIAELPELSALADKTVMVTGCTGLICSAVTDMLIRWNECHVKKISIIAAGRDIRKIRDRFSPYLAESWFQVIFFDATRSICDLDTPCDFIIHGAGNASPDVIMKEPVETMFSNIIGLKNLLEYSIRFSVERILYISSSEVYGQKEALHPYRENDYGYVDILNLRNAYSVGKRAAETLCVSYAGEYGANIVIARPGHIYGPTARPHDIRVSSAWAYAAAHGEDIVMKSEGSQIRSYCYCLDCASAILKILLRGASCHAYNISNPDSILSIREMAELLSVLADVEIKKELPNDLEKEAFNPMDNASLDSSELLKLGWKGLFDGKRGFSHTVRILRDIYENTI